MVSFTDNAYLDNQYLAAKEIKRNGPYRIRTAPGMFKAWRSS